MKSIGIKKRSENQWIQTNTRKNEKVVLFSFFLSELEKKINKLIFFLIKEHTHIVLFFVVVWVFLNLNIKRNR